MNIRKNTQPVRVLAIGADVSRLSAGANLLTQAGYSADSVLKIDDAVRRTLKSRYHLAIVCSTFTYDEQISIRSRLRQLRPHIPVLLLTAEHKSPVAFLAAVADQLRPSSNLELVAIGGPLAVDQKSPR